MAAVRLRTGMAIVVAARAAAGGSLLLVGLALGASDRIGDFGVLARAIAIAHLAAQLTDGGGLAAFTARSADPLTAALRSGARWWLTRRVVGRVLVLALPVAAVGWSFDVAPALAVAAFVAVSLQRLAAELWRSDGRTVEYGLTLGLPSVVWLGVCLALVAVGGGPTATLVTLTFALVVAIGAAASLSVVLGAGTEGRAGVRNHAIDPAAVEAALTGRAGLFLEGLLEAAVRNIDVVLVTVVVGRDEAGLYAAASRLVAVAMTPLAAANGALARAYAERWAAGGAARLSELARRVARRIVAFPAAMTVVAAVAAIVLGDDGGTGTVAMVAAVLLAAATVSTGAGSVGLLLGICRREVPSARISAVAIAASILLLLGLGSAGGLVPAAAGFAAGIAGQNIAQARYLRRRLGVVSHV